MISYYRLGQLLSSHRLWLDGEPSGVRLSLEGEILTDKSFSYADLRKANLRNTNLTGASMYRADLRGTDFRGAVLSGVNFENAIIDETTLGLPLLVCPEEGGFTAFKKVYFLGMPYIAQLYVPADAKRSSSTSRKCRCSKAKVIKFLRLDRTEAKIDGARSSWDPNFNYYKGKYVEPNKKFDENRWNECSSGIHFFMTFQEAADY